MHHTSPTTTAGIVGMKCSRSAPGFSKCHLLLVLFAGLQHIRRRPPFPFGGFCKGPGVTFSTREVTAGLIDGKVILRPREVYSRNESKGAVVCLLERCFASKEPFPPHICKTTSLRKSLLD